MIQYGAAIMYNERLRREDKNNKWSAYSSKAHYYRFHISTASALMGANSYIRLKYVRDYAHSIFTQSK